MGEWHCICHVNSTLLLPFECDVGRFFVESNAKSFQFRLDDFLVSERFIDIENNKNQVARPGHSDDLTTTSLKVRILKNCEYFAIFGSFDDTWQIEDLNLCTSILEHTRNSCQSCD